MADVAGIESVLTLTPTQLIEAVVKAAGSDLPKGNLACTLTFGVKAFRFTFRREGA